MTISGHNAKVENAADQSVHIPMEQLTNLLLREGFHLKPDDYIEMLKVIETFGTNDVAELKGRLCPIIATSQDEQARFYKVFDEYVRQAESNKASSYTPVKRAFRNKHLLWVLLVSVIAIILAIVLFIPRPGKVDALFRYTNLENGSNSIVEGDSLLLDASIMFNDKKPDTSKVKWRWEINGQAMYENMLQVTIPNVKEGSLPVDLVVESGKKGAYVSKQSQTIQVCKGILDLLQSSPADPQLNDTVTITPRFRGNVGSRVIWTLNGDTISRSREAIQYRFDTAGSYQFALIVPDTGSYCAQNMSANFTIRDPEEVQLIVQPGTTNIEPAYKKNTAWLLLLALLLVAAILYTNYRRKKAKKNIISIPDDEPEINKEVPVNGPYDVPLENKDMQQVARQNEMNNLFRLMRSKTEDDARALDINKTIQSVIRSGGMPALVFTNKTKQQEYLVLVDQVNVRNQQLKLFEYLLKLLDEENINVERFYYTSFDSFKNESYPMGISFRRLQELYKQHTLVIFGSGHQFIYSAYPVFERDKLDILKEWEYKAILTPVAYKDWDARERTLKQHIILLPADIEGQLCLMQAIREKQLNHDRFLSFVDHFYEPQSYYFNDIKEIKRYLENDTVLFQWLCAICVYPKLRWEIIIGMGKAICAKYSQPNKLNFTNLLKLVRIHWMQEGTFPEKTRLELLKELELSNELLARQTILDMLQYPDVYFKEDYFFEEEKEQQQLINKFILFAHDEKEYAHFQDAYLQFKARWRHDRVYDGPLKRYLDKKEGDRWQTPVRQNGKNPGLNEYFHVNDHQSLRAVNKKFMWALGALAILFVMVTLFAFFGTSLLSAAANKRLGLITIDSTQAIPIRFTLQTDTCQNTQLPDTIFGNLNAGNTRYDFIFNTKQNQVSAQMAVPYSQLAQSSGIVNLSWNDRGQSREVQSAVSLDASESALQLTGFCKGDDTIRKTKLYIYYNNLSAYKLVEQQLTSLLSQFDITSANLGVYDSSFISYNGDEQQAKLSTIINAVKQVLNINVQTRVPTQQNSQSSPLTLYLNLNRVPPCSMSLPSTLTEIWKGGTSNRLISINIASKMIYYSTGDKNTYGTYRVLEVCRTDNGSYRIVTSASTQYRVFFIKDVNTSDPSFSLSICQNFYSSIEEARKIPEANCDRFNKMGLYYERDTNRVYLPVQRTAFVGSEKEKLSDSYVSVLLDNGKTDNFKFSYNIYQNSRYFASLYDYYVNIVKTYYLSRTDNVTFGQSPMSNNASPFDRNYMTFKWERLPGEPQADCKRVFRTLKEALSVDPRIVCNLDLSDQNLSAIPDELRKNPFTNLQSLDIRNNRLTDSDSIELFRLLRGVKIQYTPQIRQTPPTGRKWQLLDNLQVISEQRVNCVKNPKLFEMISDELARNAQAKIKFVVFYQRNGNVAAAQRALNDVRTYVERYKWDMYMKDGRVSFEISDDINKTEQVSSMIFFQQIPTANVYGLDLSRGFLNSADGGINKN